MGWIVGMTILISMWVMHGENMRELKDFHDRLCKLEERYVHLMEKKLDKENK